MKVRQICEPPDAALSRALREFEAPFTYPLGTETTFRISHGEDYSLFFRCQGEAACFIAQHLGRVTGTLGTAIRPLWVPDGTECVTAYLGDLKIATQARGGTVLLRLAHAAETWLRPKVTSAFGVVMGGTSQMPQAYTGRAGIPEFQEVGRLMVFRISTAGADPSCEADVNSFAATRDAGLACFRQLSLGRYACPISNVGQRSQITPMWLIDAESLACGALEDTRRAKQLIAADDSEILSAHLSCFAYSTPAAGARLLRVALRYAVNLGFPALFVAIAEADAPALRAALGKFDLLAAPALVYGAGLATGLWNINSSEI